MESATRTNEASDLAAFVRTRMLLLLLLMLRVCGVRHTSSCAFVLSLALVRRCLRLSRGSESVSTPRIFWMRGGGSLVVRSVASMRARLLHSAVPLHIRGDAKIGLGTRPLGMRSVGGVSM